MPDGEWPTYVLDLQDSPTCSRLENAQPGKEILVLVRRANDQTAVPMEAIGTRSPDGQEFSIVVRTEDGKHAGPVLRLQGPLGLNLANQSVDAPSIVGGVKTTLSLVIDGLAFCKTLSH